MSRMPSLGDSILFALLLLISLLACIGASRADGENLQQGRRNVFSDQHKQRPHNDVDRPLPIEPRSSFTVINDSGLVPFLLRNITYKRRRGRKDVLRVKWGGERSRKSRVVLYGPDGNKIKGKRVKQNRKRSIDIPLRDGILQPGLRYTVKLFEKPREFRSLILLSTMEYIHPSAPVPPTSQPTENPTSMPSSNPTAMPTTSPSSKPTGMPSSRPSSKPSTSPTKVGSAAPSLSQMPSRKPSVQPSMSPSTNPSTKPSSQPSSLPSQRPSSLPSSLPSDIPSLRPSGSPSFSPSSAPSNTPTSCDALEGSCTDEDDTPCCPHPSLSEEIFCNLSVNLEGLGSQDLRCCIEDGDICREDTAGTSFDGCCDSTCSDEGNTPGDFRCCVPFNVSTSEGDCYGFSECCTGSCSSNNNTAAGKCV